MWSNAQHAQILIGMQEGSEIAKPWINKTLLFCSIPPKSVTKALKSFSIW